MWLVHYLGIVKFTMKSKYNRLCINPHGYFTKWRIKINCDKTQTILFKRIPIVLLAPQLATKPISVRNTELGATKAMNSFKALYPLIHGWSPSRLSTTNRLLLLYKTVNRLKITHAARRRMLCKWFSLTVVGALSRFHVHCIIIKLTQQDNNSTL